MEKSIVSLSNSSFSFNNGGISGGSVKLEMDCSATIRYCYFINNTAARGGAIYAETFSKMVISHSVIQYNFAIIGGAFDIQSSSDIKLTKSNVSFNIANSTNGGGGFMCSNSKLWLNQSELSNNWGPNQVDSEISCAKFPAFTTCTIQSDNQLWNSICPPQNADSYNPILQDRSFIYIFITVAVFVLLCAFIAIISIICYRRKKAQLEKNNYQMVDRIAYEENYDDQQQ